MLLWYCTALQLAYYIVFGNSHQQCIIVSYKYKSPFLSLFHFKFLVKRKPRNSKKHVSLVTEFDYSPAQSQLYYLSFHYSSANSRMPHLALWSRDSRWQVLIFISDENWFIWHANIPGKVIKTSLKLYHLRMKVF